jgi:hypothetical protein
MTSLFPDNGFEARGAIHQHSGWLLPLGVFVVTLILSALFLLYYLRPSPAKLRAEQTMPTGATHIVALRVHGRPFFIPANYTMFKRARRGGARATVALFAKLPQMSGYTRRDAGLFMSNATDSPIVYILIREDKFNLSATDRLDEIYLPYIADRQGKPGPFGLTQYAFRDDSGYRRNDLFVGETASGPLMLLCVRFSPDVSSPNCLAIDRPLAHDVTLSYRFKRSRLADWRTILDKVEKLVARFEKKPA